MDQFSAMTLMPVEERINSDPPQDEWLTMSARATRPITLSTPTRHTLVLEFQACQFADMPHHPLPLHISLDRPHALALLHSLQQQFGDATPAPDTTASTPITPLATSSKAPLAAMAARLRRDEAPASALPDTSPSPLPPVPVTDLLTSTQPDFSPEQPKKLSWLSRLFSRLGFKRPKPRPEHAFDLLTQHPARQAHPESNDTTADGLARFERHLELRDHSLRVRERVHHTNNPPTPSSIVSSPMPDPVTESAPSPPAGVIPTPAITPDAATDAQTEPLPEHTPHTSTVEPAAEPPRFDMAALRAIAAAKAAAKALEAASLPENLPPHLPLDKAGRTAININRSTRNLINHMVERYFATQQPDDHHDKAAPHPKDEAAVHVN